ncbi:MAG TPA: hypothetical protein VMW65_14925, partial [Chloroflexota bacterium]|nr:hypothetical protein [Chloroflexota bacterium]
RRLGDAATAPQRQQKEDGPDPTVLTFWAGDSQPRRAFALFRQAWLSESGTGDQSRLSQNGVKPGTPNC